MLIPSTRETTTDERIMAAVAHGSVLLLGWGIIAAIVLWITQRQKSTFVAFHALQALTYQLLQTVYWLIIVVVLVVVMMCGQFLAIASIAQSPSDTSPMVFVFSQFLFIGSFVCGFGLYAVVGLSGAALIVMGRDFYYPFLGRRIERYLSQPPSTPLQESA